MNKLLKLSVVLTAVLLSVSVIAKQSVAVVSPITHALTTALLENTQVKVVYLPPKRLPVSRIPSWLNKNRTKKFGQFDAFISTSAVRENMAFYTTLRQQNIRLVNIDIALAQTPKGERVVTGSNTDYFWLNANNQLLMLGILKRDLSALWPVHQAVIQANFITLSTKLRDINLKMDTLLMDNDVAFLTSSNNKLKPFVESLGSAYGSLEEAEEFGLPHLHLSAKKRGSKKSMLDATVWQIDDLTRFAKQPFAQRVEANLQSLRSVLNK